MAAAGMGYGVVWGGEEGVEEVDMCRWMAEGVAACEGGGVLIGVLRAALLPPSRLDNASLSPTSAQTACLILH